MRQKRFVSKLVHYCPGDSIGSPAGLRREEAERYLARDLDFVDRQIEAGVLRRPDVSWPHIDGQCNKCRR